MTGLKFLGWAVGILMLMSGGMCFIALWATPREDDDTENTDEEAE